MCIAFSKFFDYYDSAISQQLLNCETGVINVARANTSLKSTALASSNKRGKKSVGIKH